MADVFEGNSQKIFENVADALIRNGANPKTTRAVLAALMDNVGVPMLAFQRYLTDPTIVALFNERGVRLMTPDEKARYGEDGA